MAVIMIVKLPPKNRFTCPLRCGLFLNQIVQTKKHGATIETIVDIRGNQTWLNDRGEWLVNQKVIEFCQPLAIAEGPAVVEITAVEGVRERQLVKVRLMQSHVNSHVTVPAQVVPENTRIIVLRSNADLSIVMTCANTPVLGAPALQDHICELVVYFLYVSIGSACMWHVHSSYTKHTTFYHLEINDREPLWCRFELEALPPLSTTELGKSLL